jgi:hypothetical protein
MAEPQFIVSDSTKLRTSVSLSARYVIAWEIAKKLGDAHIDTFSDFVSEAILAYAAKHHPHIVTEAMRTIAENPSIVTEHKFFNAKNPTARKDRKKLPDATRVSKSRRGTSRNAMTG